MSMASAVRWRALTRDGARRWVLSDYAAFDARGNIRDAYQAAFVEQPVVEEPVGVEHERVYYDALGREVGRRLPGMARTLTVYEPMAVRLLRRGGYRSHVASSPHGHNPFLRWTAAGRRAAAEHRRHRACAGLQLRRSRPPRDPLGC